MRTRLTDNEVWAMLRLDPGDSWYVALPDGSTLYTGYSAGGGSSVGLVTHARKLIEQWEDRQ